MDARKSRISLSFVFALFAVTAVFAHNYLPSDPGSAVTMISDISVSRAAYRELTRVGQVDIYEFDATKGQEIYIQMTIPQMAALKDFTPRFVLVYTGADDAEFVPQDLKKGTIFDPPHEIVDAVFPHRGEDSKEPPLLGVAYDGSELLPFDEPFTGTRYWVRQTLTVPAPADGMYRIGVYADEPQIGKYVLAPGKKEQFGFGDLFSLPTVRWNVRVFCGEPVWPDALSWIVLSAAAVAGISVGAYYAFPH